MPDDQDTKPGGPQWGQGILGGLATLLAILAATATLRASDSWWLASLVILAVIATVMLVGRLVLLRVRK